MTSRMSLRRAPTVAGAVLLLLLTGCGSGSDDAGAEGPSGGETSTTASGSPSPSVEVPSPPPTAEPADGPLIRTEGATIRGLKTYRRVSDFGVLQGYRDDQSALSFLPGYTDAPSLDAFARQYKRVATDGNRLERVEDVVVGGEYNAWHMLDRSDPTEEGHVFGVMFLDGSWTIHISFYEQGEPRPLDEQERQEVIDSILASFEPTFA
ncbi:hypothetical protein [Nocardioides sp. SYSU D00065]|uniref:hypothetical protein n=1 Tax=Nocardioides sp. SYSU D00065 TaxID=2817378 RepID=UPI001B322F47|nr:hypothetical protein [Nocardioides sp. SYSU D00065]